MRADGWAGGQPPPEPGAGAGERAVGEGAVGSLFGELLPAADPCPAPTPVVVQPCLATGPAHPDPDPQPHVPDPGKFARYFNFIFIGSS